MVIKIHVECYSGHKLFEKPKRFVLNGKEYNINTIIDSYLEESLESKERKFWFKVLCDDEKKYRIFYDESYGQWYMNKEIDD